jgi:hypothetical protein
LLRCLWRGVDWRSSRGVLVVVVGELRLRRRGMGMLRRFLDVFGERDTV